MYNIPITPILGITSFRPSLCVSLSSNGTEVGTNDLFRKVFIYCSPFHFCIRLTIVVISVSCPMLLLYQGVFFFSSRLCNFHRSSDTHLMLKKYPAQHLRLERSVKGTDDQTKLIRFIYLFISLMTPFVSPVSIYLLHTRTHDYY